MVNEHHIEPSEADAPASSWYVRSISAQAPPCTAGNVSAVGRLLTLAEIGARQQPSLLGQP